MLVAKASRLGLLSILSSLLVNVGFPGGVVATSKWALPLRNL